MALRKLLPQLHLQGGALEAEGTSQPTGLRDSSVQAILSAGCQRLIFSQHPEMP